MSLKGKNDFKILLKKVFSLKQKTNQILPATIEKIIFCLQENSLMYLQIKIFVEISNRVDKGLKWGHVKQKTFWQI